MTYPLNGTCPGGVLGLCHTCAKGWRKSKKRYRVTSDGWSRLSIRRDRWPR